jgi:hypothetical protein
MRQPKKTNASNSPAKGKAKTETAPVTETTPQTEEQKKPQVALFGQLGFETVGQYEEYIGRMKQNNYNDILLTVNVALRSVSQRGGFSLEENEAVSVALRHLNGAFTVVDPSASEAPAEQPAPATEPSVN